MTAIRVTSGDDYGIDGSNDRRLVITVTKDGATVDLTDTELTFMVKRRRSDDDDDAVITKTVGDGLTLADPQTGATKGKAYLTLEAADTDDLSGKLLWELQAEDAVGVITLAAGGFYVTADLIRES